MGFYIPLVLVGNLFWWMTWRRPVHPWISFQEQTSVLLFSTECGETPHDTQMWHMELWNSPYSPEIKMATRRSTSVQRRDPDGLLIEQRRFFQELALYGDPKIACEKADVSYNRFKSWLGRDRHFQAAYDTALGPSLNIVREMLETSAPRAAGVLDEALEASDPMEHDTICPECNHHFMIVIQIPNHQVKLKASEMILRATRMLKDVREVEGTITHIGLEDRLALSMYKAWQTGVGSPIPPNVLSRLKTLHLIPDDHTPTKQYPQLTEVTPSA